MTYLPTSQSNLDISIWRTIIFRADKTTDSICYLWLYINLICCELFLRGAKCVFEYAWQHPWADSDRVLKPDGWMDHLFHCSGRSLFRLDPVFLEYLSFSSKLVFSEQPLLNNCGRQMH